jgi:L-threonylcarbamoyladenylate synthase
VTGHVKTRTLVVDADAPDSAVLREAADVLRRGGLVAFPTETVYGLGGLARDEPSIARIFAAKGRPSHHPLIAHVLGEPEARALAATWSDVAVTLVRAFWPGPLTLVVPRAASVPAALAGGGPTVAVRAPANAVARGLLEALGEPIAAPSANRYQTLSPTTAAHVLRSLDGRVDLVLDGGPCAAGIESTVLDISGDVPRLLRPGAVDPAALRRVIGAIETESRAPDDDERRASPGMDARHYAPRGQLRVVAGRARAMAEAHAEAERGRVVGLIVRRDLSVNSAVKSLSELPRAVHVRELDDEPVAYARALFAALHAMDERGADILVVESVPADDEAWWAVADRLERGSTPT